MYRISKPVVTSTALVLGFLAVLTPAKSNKPSVKIDNTRGTPVLWRDPGDIASRNLFYGPGGKAHEPRGTFTFEKEDMNGTNPKFDVVDEDGVKWRVKMGAGGAAGNGGVAAGLGCRLLCQRGLLHAGAARSEDAAPAPRKKSGLGGRHRA